MHQNLQLATPLRMRFPKRNLPRSPCVSYMVLTKLFLGILAVPKQNWPPLLCRALPSSFCILEGIRFYIMLSIQLSIYHLLSIYLLSQSIRCPSISLSASLSIDLFKVYLSLYLSIYSAIHLSSPPAISILLSICLCIYRSILIIYPVYPYLLLSLSLYISLHLSTMSIPLAIYLFMLQNAKK